MTSAIKIFRDAPQVELLQWLARGSLKQNLLRAIRLWVWLHSLYGEPEERLKLEPSFTYAQWRNAFFTSSHTRGEEVPPLHDSHCLCAKTTAQWLFEEKTGIDARQWQKLLLDHTGIEPSQLQKVLQRRLFGVTRRSLQGDLETLADLGWLIYKNSAYHCVQQFPQRPLTAPEDINARKLSAYELNFLHEDLVEIAENHAHRVNGIQRFFLKVDYVIPRVTLDLVDDWQEKLKDVWGQTPIPPVKITYLSAKIRDRVNCVVYPVCIYYVQRAIYLCAYGDSPDRETLWYNFRVDRILRMTTLTWGSAQISRFLRREYQKRTLPEPEYIVYQMSRAWGFDFYLPARLMLIRFDREFGDRYVKNTERHDTFEEITYQYAQKLIYKEVKEPEQQGILLEALANRSPKDTYYQVYIRYQDNEHRDNNVIMRLRAWRPKCEVFFPFELREGMAAEVAQEYHLYF